MKAAFKREEKSVSLAKWHTIRKQENKSYPNIVSTFSVNNDFKWMNEWMGSKV